MPQPITFSLRPTPGFPLVSQPLRLPLNLACQLTDNFDDNARDPTLWTTGPLYGPSYVAGTTTVSETNGRVEVTPQANAGPVASGYIFAAQRTLADNSVHIRITNTAAHSARQESYLSFGTTQDILYRGVISGGVLYFQRVVTAGGGTVTVGSTLYSSTTHAWLRIRHSSSGDTIYFDTAPSSASDPPASTDWTNQWSEARTSAVPVLGYAGFGSSTFAPGDASPGTVYFDGFNTATTIAVSNDISGTSSLTFAPSATTTGLGTLGGSSALTFADSGTLIGLGTVAGSSSLAFAPSGTATGLGGLTGASALTFTPSGTATGLGALAGTTTLTFAGSGTATGLGALAGTSSLVLDSQGTLTGLGALLASTALSFALSGTLGTAGSNDIAGSASLAFVSSGTLSGLGQMAGSTTFSLTISGQLVGGSFVPTPRPAPANLTTPAPPSETNVIGPAHPSKVAVTTVSAASGTFVPSTKPPRVQWRT